MRELMTAKQAALELGLSQAQLCRILDKMDAPKMGSVYVIDANLLDQLRQRPRRGRPKGAKTKPKK